MRDGLVIAARHAWVGEPAGAWRAPAAFVMREGALHPLREAPTHVDVHIPGTLIPRLTDHHVHLGLIDAPRLLAGGITRVTDLGWAPAQAAAWLADSRRPDTALPEVRIAGGFLTCRGGYPSRSGWAPAGATIEIARPTDAAAAVDAQLALGASVIKLTLNADAGPTPDLALARAIVAAATARGVPVVAHAQGPGQAARALEAGVARLAHAPFSEPLGDELLRAMVRAGMSWISTLDIHGWGTPTRAFDVAVANVRRFVALGGRVLYGTDLGNGLLPVGVDERELLALADAGMTPTQLMTSIAGSGNPPQASDRYAWMPGAPPETAHETARWLATARGVRTGIPAA